MLGLPTLEERLVLWGMVALLRIILKLSLKMSNAKSELQLTKLWSRHPTQRLSCKVINLSLDASLPLAINVTLKRLLALLLLLLVSVF